MTDAWGLGEPPLTEGRPVPPLDGRLATLDAFSGWCRLDGHADPALAAALDAGWVRAEELPGPGAGRTRVAHVG